MFGAIGAARDCLESALAYAAARTQFGRPIASFQLTQQKLADMSLELSKGLLLGLHLARLKEAGTLRPEQVSVGKLNNVREAIRIARECRTILGGAGITLDYPPLRHAQQPGIRAHLRGHQRGAHPGHRRGPTGLSAYR